MLATLLRRLSLWARSPRAAPSDVPVPIAISAAGIEMNGVRYTSTTDFVAALRLLNPKEVRFMPAPGTNYYVLENAVRAFQLSGVRAKTGFVGNIRFDEYEKPIDHGSVS